MISVAIFIFNGVVLYILGFRSLLNYRKSANNFIAKGFFWLGLLAGTGYLLLATDILLELRGMHRASALVDTAATGFIYLSMISTVWMTSRFLRRPQFGYVIQALVAISGAYVVWFNLFFTRSTYVSSQGIATYVDGGDANTLFGLTILTVYTWAFIVFIRAGLKNPHIRAKLLTLGTGLLVASWSGALLAAIPPNFNGYLIGYGVLAFSYVLHLIGVLMPSRD